MRPTTARYSRCMSSTHDQAIKGRLRAVKDLFLLDPERRLSEPRLVRRLPAAGVRDLPGAAARARAAAGRVPGARAPLSGTARRGAARARRVRRRAARRPGLRDEHELGAERGRCARCRSARATRCCSATPSTAASRSSGEFVAERTGADASAGAVRGARPVAAARGSSSARTSSGRPAASTTWRRCARAARAVGALSIVDGAHAPGQIPTSTSVALGADVYAGNCHKWLCAPKGSAFLYARPDAQASIEPLVVSWDWVDGAPFQQRHRWQGTRDPAALLAVPAAIAFQAEHDWPSVRGAATRCSAGSATTARSSRSPTSTCRCSASACRSPTAPRSSRRCTSVTASRCRSSRRSDGWVMRVSDPGLQRRRRRRRAPSGPCVGRRALAPGVRQESDSCLTHETVTEVERNRDELSPIPVAKPARDAQQRPVCKRETTGEPLRARAGGAGRSGLTRV